MPFSPMKTGEDYKISYNCATLLKGKRVEAKANGTLFSSIKIVEASSFSSLQIHWDYILYSQA